jgi:hypothetical protein
MPSSTARFRFEFRMLEWAENLSRSLCGDRRALFVGLRADGAVRRVYFASGDESFEGDRKTRLAQSHPGWLLFLPHGEAGTGYVEWFGLDAKVAERWMAHRLDAADYVDVRGRSERTEWPTTWRVLVA